ncbi:MAG TPA: hypothetical protein VFB60_03620 [Ktedonobacteraceae bacterium]|nr:hypothetical protein [Ktedonobacteraceae bacterium]
MRSQDNPPNWHLQADRFIWYDSGALSLIPEEISDEEIQQYLYVYHGDTISIDEIKKWRRETVKDCDLL